MIVDDLVFGNVVFGTGKVKAAIVVVRPVSENPGPFGNHLNSSLVPTAGVCQNESFKGDFWRRKYNCAPVPVSIHHWHINSLKMERFCHVHSASVNSTFH